MNKTTILNNLETDFSEANQNAINGEIELLTKIAMRVEHSTELRESLTSFRSIFIGFGAVAIFAMIMAVLVDNLIKGQIVWVAVSLAVAIVEIIVCYRIIKRTSIPIMTLDKFGASFPVLDKQVPWTAWKDFEVASGFLIVTLDPEYDAGMPKKGRYNMIFQPKKNKIAANTLSYKGMNVDAVFNLIEYYRISGIARAKLESLRKFKTI